MSELPIIAADATADVSGEPTTPPTPSPRCLHIRTKMDYVSIDWGRPSGGSEDDTDETTGGTAHRYYCLHTLTVIGPDQDIVAPRACDAGRACYESSGF